MYKRQTDYRTAEDVGVDRPNKNERLHHIPPTPEQEDFIDVYKRQARRIKGSILLLRYSCKVRRLTRSISATSLSVR